jgi:hypothetical protein
MLWITFVAAQPFDDEVWIKTHRTSTFLFSEFGDNSELRKYKPKREMVKIIAMYGELPYFYGTKISTSPREKFLFVFVASFKLIYIHNM